MDRIEEKLHDLLVAARRAGATAAEARVGQGHTDTLSIRNGRIETLVHAAPEGWALKVWVGARSASLSTTDLDRSEAVPGLIERTLVKARLAPENPYAGLASADQIGGVTTQGQAALQLSNPAGVDPSCMRELAMAAEDAAMAVPGVIRSDGAEASSSRSKSYHITSEGLLAESARTSFALDVRVLAGSVGNKEAGVEKPWSD